MRDGRVRPGSGRRYKQGRLVPQDGLYSDGWGGELILIRGEQFPIHPYMGDTYWTFIGPPGAIFSSKRTFPSG